MKEGKEIGTTSATSHAGLIAGHLRMTSPPAEKYGDHQTVGSICCPNCSHELTTELLVDFFKKCVDQLGLWKFEPSDQQLIDQLEAKINKFGDLKPNPLIDEFISTIEGEEGICYTHPDRLPGITKDGTSKYFFHKPSKAYKTGTRKRRRIQSNVKFSFCDTRWHKTGKTKPVISNGILKGCKQILVLYNNFGKIMKPGKTNWIMHQYHLGAPTDETEGEFVLSKIFYQMQQRQPSDGKRVAVEDELCESRHTNEARLEPRMQPEVCEASGYMPPHLNVHETPTQVSPSPAFHLNATSGPFTQFVTAPPIYEASGSLGNNYQLHNMPATSTYDQTEHQQCHDDMLAATLEEILGYTSADQNEGTSNAPLNEDWELFFDWQTDCTQDQPGSHG